MLDTRILTQDTEISPRKYLKKRDSFQDSVFHPLYVNKMKAGMKMPLKILQKLFENIV